MTTTPEAGPGNPAGRGPGWVVVTASQLGASHAAVGAPNQDAVLTEAAGSAGVVAAVADGHGHSRHLRSGRGSRLAVAVGGQVAQELAGQIEDDGVLSASANGAATAERLQSLLQEFCVPEVIERWRAAVLADVQADPFTDAEQQHRHPGDDPVIAYGSTLLLGLTVGDWLLLAQIGDGDVVGVLAGGACVLPVPADPQLDGLVTTSLCGSDPRQDFRVAAVNTQRQPLIAVLLATDGYGNAQVVEDWPAAFSADLAWMLRDRDVHWLDSQLPSWAARCASSDGSADDTTVALMVAPAAARLRPSMPSAQGAGDGSEETTIPAVPHADTVPVPVPAEAEPPEPATLRLLAHRQAPEPVIVERTAPAGHEPATNELPRLGQRSGAAAAAGPASEGGGDGEPQHHRDATGAEPPTTRWRPPGRGER